MPLTSHAFCLAHIGLAVTVVGISSMAAWAVHEKERLQIGESMQVGNYTITALNAESLQGPNYISTAVTLGISDVKGSELTPLVVENRRYPIEGRATAEGSLNNTIFRTIYATVGEGDRERGWVIEAYYHPFVGWIWGGALMMSFAGFLSLADSRARNQISSSNRSANTVNALPIS